MEYVLSFPHLSVKPTFVIYGRLHFDSEHTLKMRHHTSLKASS